MKRTPHTSLQRTGATTAAGATPPTGATLTEVLVSILIMAIGVVSLASIFPIAILRSIQANQLTMATDLRKNAEALLDIHPWLFSDPDRNGVVGEHTAQSYIIDPLGMSEGLPNQVGGSGILRSHAGVTGSAAAALVTSPDTWTQLYTSTVLSHGATTADVEDLGTQGLTVGSIPMRVILLDEEGRAAHMRTVTQISGDTVEWNGDLPADFVPTTAQLEMQEERFSWLLTVRGRGTTETAAVFNVDIVVFFRRGFLPEDDTLFENGGSNVFTMRSNQATVTFDGTAPFLRKGSYVLDAKNGYWYQIRNYNVSGNTATIELATPARMNSDGAIFMKGIVDVYPLGTRQVPLDP